MTHRTTSRFWDLYRALPAAIQALADKNFELLKADPTHPSLHFKRIATLWSARVGAHYRALGVEREGDLIWFWIGHHRDYERIVRRA